jgi:hypothetical protein
MKILALGDSFTYGAELPNRLCSWPNVLEQQTGCSVRNLGTPGGSNDRFIRQVFEEYKNYDLIVLCWSHPSRFEVGIDNKLTSVTPTTAIKESFSWAIEYYKNHYSNFDAHFKWLTQVLMMQSFFKQHDQKYIFCSTFGTDRTLDKDEQTNYLPILQKMINDVDADYYIDWHQQGMMDWVKDCPLAYGGHPLELGHQQIANKINEHIRNFGWLS